MRSKKDSSNRMIKMIRTIPSSIRGIDSREMGMEGLEWSRLIYQSIIMINPMRSRSISP